MTQGHAPASGSARKAGLERSGVWIVTLSHVTRAWRMKQPPRGIGAAGPASSP
jgi:hypothetical protein